MYSDDTLKEMAQNKRKWSSAANDLFLRFIDRNYKTDAASEYARHGFSRRVQALVHLTDRVFSIIPPNSQKSPSKEVRHDAEAFVQSFLVNVYGAIDNMARIWCVETDLRNLKGVPIADGMIGFGPKNIRVRESVPDDLRDYLVKCDPWFGYLENYRHAVAHRIPVYIPPAALNDKDAEEYRRIEDEIGKAIRERDFELWGELMAKQRALGTFKPVMMHSYGENARPVTVHAQMICDTATVVEIGEHLLKVLPNGKCAT
ncbi:hypothetical protein RE411_00910 [Agrobacterium pusense]|uniref:hypothetical protein n=1 Tax=Agrobacterium pusense TaxID=648995 RepID=UPI000C2D1CA1|nr:hypothetical protein [Agrobacterium pusense]AUC08906.1 hypothetical protein BLX90_00990 [Rhizobium sp. Y9]WMW55785.1 hypothetical protein RE411_00910 [Agrobacterium pusense]